METVCVSILCITYNHRKYIRQCLDSMLSQKTSFRYEVIVHDDASTDGTAEIVKEYAEKYPGIVKAICQTENQYSQGKKPADLAIQYAEGEYVAICEADDYWCDENKLQIQYSYMSTHPECSICFHDVACFDEATGEWGGAWSFWNHDIWRGVGVYSSEEMMKQAVVPFCSIFYRKADHDYVCLFSKKARFGDALKTMHLATLGYGYCCDGKMSVYRKSVPGSAMTVNYRNIESYNNYILATIETFLNFDKYHGRKYHSIMTKKMEECRKGLIIFHEKPVGQLCKGAEHIYIYGTGIYGRICYRELSDRHIKPDGFVVTDKYYSESNIYGIKIFKYSSVPQNSAFIIAVGKKAREQIIAQMESENRSYCVGIEERIQG